MKNIKKFEKYENTSDEQTNKKLDLYNEEDWDETDDTIDVDDNKKWRYQKKRQWDWNNSVKPKKNSYHYEEEEEFEKQPTFRGSFTPRSSVVSRFLNFFREGTYDRGPN